MKIFPITNATGYVNCPSEDCNTELLVGKSIFLVSIWTLGCGNCVRTLPFLNEMYEKYVGEGFDIISIHSPEFDFERSVAAVEEAAREHDIKYPIILDNTLENFSKLDNHYWPCKYLIDIQGEIVGKYVGEGDYDKIEEDIQTQLKKV